MLKRKSKNRFVMVVLAALLMCGSVLGGLFAGISASPASASAQTETHKNIRTLNPITADNDSEDNGVYDSNEKKLYYYELDGTVFNEDYEIIANSLSNPVYYNPDTKTFADSQINMLTVSKKDSFGEKSYLFSEGMRAFGIKPTDEFYEFFRPDNSKILVSVKLIFETTYKLGFIPWKKTFYYSLKDVHGNNLSSLDLDISFSYLFNKVTQKLIDSDWGNTSKFLVKSDSLAKQYPYGKFSELLKTIDYIHPNAEIKNLLADNDKPINVVGNQLFDNTSLPLIGNDFKPLYFFDGWYLGFDARVLSVSTDGYLMDGNTKVHSVQAEQSKERIWYVYMSDRKTLCPLYATPIPNSEGEWSKMMLYTYLNGDVVNEKDFIFPNIDENELYKEYPELVPKKTIENMVGDVLLSVTKAIRDFFIGIWKSIVAFYDNYAMYIYIVIVVVILALTSGLWIPLVAVFFKAVWRGIVAVFKAIGRAVSWPFKKVKDKY